ncbi:MAG: S8 family serine peptidase, partial [Candidatus Kariarchaeaceae archaeon]
MLFDGYPGTIFVVSAGNGAPGFGTSASPASASMAITVGSSTIYNYLNNSGKNDVAFFSGRGPTIYGAIKPDIIAPGHTGFVNRQVIRGLGNGTYASGTFGGTSEAAPRVAGVIALMIEAYRDQGIDPDIGTVKLALKATATDIGFHTTQQGVGMVNAFKAISSIVNEEIFLSTTYQSELLAQRLDPVVKQLYGSSETHPLIDTPIADPISLVTPDLLESGINVQIRYSNGTIVEADDYSAQLMADDVASSEILTYTSESIINEVYLNEIIPNLDATSLLEIGVSMDRPTWDAMFENGLNTPNMTLYDVETGILVADITSFNTWSQLLYAGKAGTDFHNDILLRFVDPGFDQSVSNWQGMTLEIRARVFDEIIQNEFDLTKNNGSISISSNKTFDEFVQFDLNVEVDGDTLMAPIVVLPVIQAEMGEISPVGFNGTVEQAYSQDSITNTFDWGFRPESGEFRHYQIAVPAEATYLAVFAQWDDPGLIPHLYLFNSTGDLVKNTDVTYVGGGFYEFTTSEV